MIVAYMIIGLIVGALAGGLSLGVGGGYWQSFLIAYLASIGAFAVAAGMVMVRRSERTSTERPQFGPSRTEAGYRTQGSGTAVATEPHWGN